jgi:hypothetical protein
MPAIQVYKHKGTMIPVEKAKTARAYVCPWTGELYATKRSYVGHLKRLRTERMHKRARYLRHHRKLEDMWNQPDFDSVIRWIHLNPEVFWENAKRQGWHSDGGRWDKVRDTFEVKITSLNLSYSDCISNSHACPHNGVTNWGGRDTFNDGTLRPRGYPGFSGRIELHMPVEPLSFSSDVFRGTRIHTGTGGGGGNGNYGYEVKFFLADWPGIADRIAKEKEKHEKDGIIDMIKNEYKPYVVPNFTFGKGRW